MGVWIIHDQGEAHIAIKYHTLKCVVQCSSVQYSTVQCSGVSTNMRTLPFYCIILDDLGCYIFARLHSNLLINQKFEIFSVSLLTTSSLWVLGVKIGPQLQQRSYHWGMALLKETFKWAKTVNVHCRPQFCPLKWRTFTCWHFKDRSQGYAVIQCNYHDRSN